MVTTTKWRKESGSTVHYIFMQCCNLSHSFTLSSFALIYTAYAAMSLLCMHKLQCRCWNNILCSSSNDPLTINSVLDSWIRISADIHADTNTRALFWKTLHTCTNKVLNKVQTKISKSAMGKCATNQSHHVIRIGPWISDINLISKSVNNVGIDRKIHDYSKQV